MSTKTTTFVYFYAQVVRETVNFETLLNMFGIKKKDEIKRLLIMRFSAMGDVAMTVPVVHLLAEQHRELRITVLTRSRLVPLYEWVPANVEVMGINLDDYSGIAGLTKLYNTLKQRNFDAVADLHDVLRTKYLRTCFTMGGAKVKYVDKGRSDKHALIGNGQTATPLRPMVERYADVFRSLGIDLDVTTPPKINLCGEDFNPIRNFAGIKEEGDKWIGIAPFAAHAQKVYPLKSMKLVAHELAKQGYKVFLFGAGKVETLELESWEEAGVVSTSGKLGGLHNEMLLMSKLDLMISMDSANMHIASLLTVPVLSIWGATHPKAGFEGYGQSSDSIMQIDLPCRPCSIYGNKQCQFGDLRCMNIEAEAVIAKVKQLTQK